MKDLFWLVVFVAGLALFSYAAYWWIQSVTAPEPEPVSQEQVIVPGPPEKVHYECENTLEGCKG